ncbi:MAG: DUF4856 domain-containing protein [Myxococcales bacterium]|nr:DUF4856 domain-containing protein [Myxococcota bacterium]MDW8282678.1 DUF4856 domain-containing protein [Myxococcales bacterium]
MRRVHPALPVAVLALVGCGSAGSDPTDPNACTLGPLPSSYEGSAFETHTAVERDLRARFQALTQLMKDAEANLMVRPSAAELQALYAAGNPSLRSITTSALQARVEGWLMAFAAAAGREWTPQAMPMGPGGRFGAYIFNAEGTDLRQAIEKSLFAAAFYHHALALMNGPISVATLDRMVAIYGAHASFPGSTTAMPHPDQLAAAYARRRDRLDPNNPGPYLKIKTAFITARAALERGAACTAERDAALRTVRSEWERALFATVIYYLHDAIQRLAMANPPAAEQARALHSYGEAIGFISGWRQLPQTGRQITDAQVDELLTELGAPPSGPVTSYRLITDTATQLPRLARVIERVAALYGFTPQQVEDFKNNYQ